jgi:hypothetical protein
MFKSLSTRDVEMWYVDGSPEMVLVGVLHAGEITALNGRVGDEFVFTDSSDKENVLNHFTLRADKVRYITYTLCAKPLNIIHEVTHVHSASKIA